MTSKPEPTFDDISVQEEGRIYFSDGNPWPEGHRITEFYLDADLWLPRTPYSKRSLPTLWVAHNLETERYYDNDKQIVAGDEDGESDWGSKIVWNNYHSCSIGGQFYECLPDNPFRHSDLSGKRFRIDPLPAASQQLLDDQLTFSIYLLGHDAVADHCLEFGPWDGRCFPAKWSGRIALAYAGETDFCYGFDLTARLAGIRRVYVRQHDQPMPSHDELKKMLGSVLIDGENFGIEEKHNTRLIPPSEELS